VQSDAVSRAVIESGALVKASALDVDAKTLTTNVSVGLSGGKSSKGGLNGVANVVSITNTTLARIDEGAVVVSTGTVDVNALDDVFNLNVAGGITIGKSAGFGITAGTNIITRTTRALIGNEDAALGNGTFTPATGVDGGADTIDLGYPHGFVTGDTVRYSDPDDQGAIGGLQDGGLDVIQPVLVIDDHQVRRPCSMPG
jgi:hypothetical protein